MVAKLIVWGENRHQAIERALYALSEYHLGGLNTTVPFCQFAINSESFRSGKYSTAFVKEFWEPIIPDELQRMLTGAAAFAKINIASSRKPNFKASTSAWSPL
jgi:acetyl/propionyl-CoA carboxylase alpha subunit